MTEQLLHVLEDRVNPFGVAMTREGWLKKELGVTGRQVRSGIRKLEESGLVEILNPFPFLVLRLKTWPGKRQNAGSSSPPYSYSLQSKLLPTKRLKKSYSDSAGELPPSLLQDILETLGESDPTLFEKVLKHYPESVIRTALTRVQSAKSIKKNRTALFRYLLPRIAEESEPLSH